jgi:hypothetical protein
MEYAQGIIYVWIATIVCASIIACRVDILIALKIEYVRSRSS